MQPDPKSNSNRNRPQTQIPGPRPNRARRTAAWLAVLLVIPMLLLGPAMAPNKRFLPQLPVASLPMAEEHPELAAEARAGSNYSTADGLFQILTDRIEARDQMRTGTLPTWDPNVAAGIPLFAGTIAAIAYPPNWLALVLPPDLAAAPLALLSLFLAGLGMALFLRRLGLPMGAVLVGALAAQAGTWAIDNLHYYMKVDAALWLPWMLWSVEGMVQGKRRSGPWLAASIGLSLLAGFPPISIFAIATTGLYALVRFLGKDTRARCGKLFLQAGLYVVLGFGIGAWQLLPTAETSGLSTRIPRDQAFFEAQALPIGSSLGLLAPDVFGEADEPVFAGSLPIVWLVTGHEDAESALTANALEWNLHLGSLALLLALVAIFTRPRQAAFAFGALLLWIGFSQGWPGLRLLYAVPGLDFGAPNRAIGVAWFLMPWLAAVGTAALISDIQPGRAAPKTKGAAKSKGAAPWAAALIGGTTAIIALGTWFLFDAHAFPAWLTDLMVERHGVTKAEVAAAMSDADMLSAALRLKRLLIGLFCTGGLLCAATLLATFGRRSPQATRGTTSLRLFLGGALGLGFAFAPRIAAGSFEDHGALYLLAIFVGVVLVMLFVQTLGRKSVQAAPFGMALAIALMAGIVVEAVEIGPSHLRPRTVRPGDLFPESPTIDAIASSLAMDADAPGNIPGAADGRVLRVDLSASGAGEVISLVQPNLLEGYGLKDLTPYKVFMASTLVELMGAFDPGSPFRSGISRLSNPALMDGQVLDMLRVNTILSKHDLVAAGVPGLTKIDFEKRPGTSPFFVYHREGALPIARLVPNARIAPDDATAVKWLLAEDFDPARETILAPSTITPPESRLIGLPDAASDAASARPWTDASIITRRPSASRLDMQVESEKGGWLVMSEQFAPDWKVNIDGQDAVTMRTDHVFRALYIPPGKHLVRTWYEPWSLRYGFLILLGSCATLAWLVLRRKV
jgi:hypothetical protein